MPERDQSRVRTWIPLFLLWAPTIAIAFISRIKRSVIFLDSPAWIAESFRPELGLYLGALIASIGWVLGRPERQVARMVAVAAIAWLGFGAEFVNLVAFETSRTAMDLPLMFYGASNAAMLWHLLVAVGLLYAVVIGAALLAYSAICIRVFAREGQGGPGIAQWPLWALPLVLVGLPGAAGMDNRLLARAAPVTLVASMPDVLADEPRSPPDHERYRTKRVVFDKPPQYDHVAMIVLESVGWHQTTLSGLSIPTTPTLQRLASEGWAATRAYITMNHSSKAWVAIFCGAEPRPSQEVVEYLPGRLPYRCLPEMLGDAGFRTHVFHTGTSAFEGKAELYGRFGFQERTMLEHLPPGSGRPVNYFGLEEDAMLPTGEAWLAKHGGDRTFATWLTLSPHHDYAIPDDLVRHAWSDHPEHNRYLNAVAYVDGFIDRVIDVYRRQGVLDRTLFVIVGDHGEGFDEHKLLTHDGVPYEEVTRVPLVFWSTSLTPQRWDGLASQMDIAPTIEALLGGRSEGAPYSGHRLDQLPAERSLYGLCWTSQRCGWEVRSDGTKRIHFFGHQPDLRFDLTVDPRERAPAVDPEPPTGLTAWRRAVEARYYPLAQP